MPLQEFITCAMIAASIYAHFIVAAATVDKHTTHNSPGAVAVLAACIFIVLVTWVAVIRMVWGWL